LRDDHDRFAALGAEVLAIAPESMEAASRYLRRQPVPYLLLVDADHVVFDRWDVISTLRSLGQRPALFVVDAEGVVRSNQVGTQQWEIPANEQVLAILAGL
jgi:peroxiredoxin